MSFYPSEPVYGTDVLLQDLKVSAYRIPTDYPESDGTYEWDVTTLVLVEVTAGGRTGIGYTYADAAAAVFIDKTLRKVVAGIDVMQVPAAWQAMTQAARNDGSGGLAAMAISAVDVALWDLKAKITDLPLALLLGQARNSVEIYGSGGFTSYPLDKLELQLGGWKDEGITRVKMKVGRDPEKDVSRVTAARAAIGWESGLFVDANGAYSAKEALRMADHFGDMQVAWFEEPVPSSDLRGLHFIRQQVPPSMQVAAGEYGYNLPYFEAMLVAGAVDVLQADATRCGGITGFLKAGYLCEAHQLPFSSHCAPALHLHAALALPAFYIAEYFYDHVRIEKMLFDGVQQPVNGALLPDLQRPGLGLEFKRSDAKRFEI